MSNTSSLRLVSDGSQMPAGCKVTQLQPAVGSTVAGYRFDGLIGVEFFQQHHRGACHQRTSQSEQLPDALRDGRQ